MKSTTPRELTDPVDQIAGRPAPREPERERLSRGRPALLGRDSDRAARE